MVDPVGLSPQLNQLASNIGNGANASRSVASGVSNVALRAGEIGDNSLSSFLITHANKDSQVLSNASGELGTVSRAVSNLAATLTRLQSQAAGMGPTPSVGDPTFTTHIAQVDSLRSQAKAARHTAARIIETSAGLTQLTKGYHYKHWYQYPWEFIGGAWDGGYEMVSGAVTIVEHPVTFVKGIGTLAENLATHPASTGAELWDSVVNTKMMHEDFTKWLGYVTVNVASLFVGVGAIKAASKSSEVADAAIAVEKASGTSEAAKGISAAEVTASGAEKLDTITLGELGQVEVNSSTELPISKTIDYDGFLFSTDEQGRLSRIRATLELGDGGGYSDSVRQAVRPLGGPTDDVGHMIARIFKGPYENINLLPQDANLNRGAWRAMEQDWAKSIAQGHAYRSIFQSPTLGAQLDPSRFLRSG